MHPPAEVEPARISHGEQASSSSAMFRMSAARAVSRLEKLILRIASITGRASKAVISTCSTVFASSSALVLGVGAFISSLAPLPLRGGVGGGGLSVSPTLWDRKDAASARPQPPSLTPPPRARGLLAPPLPATGRRQLDDVCSLGARRGQRAWGEAEHRQHWRVVHLHGLDVAKAVE